MLDQFKFLPGSKSQPADRRNEYDVTNTVNVSSSPAVRDAVQQLLAATFPQASLDVLWLAFHDFDLLYEGRLPGYRGCDTVYHDKQHSLDMTLTMARLLAGHERTADKADQLGAERAIVGVITALFHDAGYIRRDDEPRRHNGAEFTIWHVSRSADFLRLVMPKLGYRHWSETAAKLVHFTGYEINIDDIELADPTDALIGHFLGTADLMAQMADRCYLEKCRDRLYSEFVLGGVAIPPHAKGPENILYQSGIDLLKKTPGFYQHMAMSRLDDKFNHAYRYIEALYDGRNPYMEFIGKNQQYLNTVIEQNAWHKLRRNPPCYTAIEQPLKSVSALVSRMLADHNAPASALTIS
ncbi:MAG: hypothetical protein OEU86_01735 [Gammaproteobacteria bacterium]|nr:hypothetical protein [Gammaproteobacteria bacterium]